MVDKKIGLGTKTADAVPRFPQLPKVNLLVYTEYEFDQVVFSIQYGIGTHKQTKRTNSCTH